MEFYGIVVSAESWVALVPVTLITSDIAETVVSVVADLLDLDSQTTVACAAHLTSLEVVSIIASTGVWVLIVPLTSVSSGIGGTKSDISAASFASAAHGSSNEVWGIVEATARWVRSVPVTFVTETVAKAFVGILASFDSGKTSIASAAHRAGSEVIVIPIATEIWVRVVPFTAVVSLICGSKSSV